MKVRDFKYKNKMLKGVVMVNPEDEGIYDIINSESVAAEQVDNADDGELVLTDNHFDDRMHEEEADFDFANVPAFSVEKVQRKVAEALEAGRGRISQNIYQCEPQT